MKALCKAGHKNCCGNDDQTSNCDYPFIPGKDLKTQKAEGHVKSVFAGPSFNVDIEFKELSFAVKVKGRGEI